MQKAREHLLRSGHQFGWGDKLENENKSNRNESGRLAEEGAVIPLSCGVIPGVGSRAKEAYLNLLFLGFAGGAAKPVSDCWLTTGRVGNAGGYFKVE